MYIYTYTTSHACLSMYVHMCTLFCTHSCTHSCTHLSAEVMQPPTWINTQTKTSNGSFALNQKLHMALTSNFGEALQFTSKFPMITVIFSAPQ